MTRIVRALLVAALMGPLVAAAQPEIVISSGASLIAYENWNNPLQVVIENAGDAPASVLFEVEVPTGWSVGWGDTSNKTVPPRDDWTIEVGVIPPLGSAGARAEVHLRVRAEDGGGVLAERYAVVTVLPADDRPPAVRVISYGGLVMTGAEHRHRFVVVNDEWNRTVDLSVRIDDRPWLLGQAEWNGTLAPWQEARVPFAISLPDDAPLEELVTRVTVYWRGSVLTGTDLHFPVRRGLPLSFETLDYGPASANVTVRNRGTEGLDLRFDPWDQTVDATWSHDAEPATAYLPPGASTTVRITAHGDPPADSLEWLVLRAEGGDELSEGYVVPLDEYLAGGIEIYGGRTDAFSDSDAAQGSEPDTISPGSPDAAAPVTTHPQTVAINAHVVAAAGIVAVSLGTVWVATRDISRWAVAVLFTKLSRQSALDQPSRQEILRCAQQRPGITFSEIRNATGLGSGTAVHHLRVLVREGFLTTRRDGQFRRFYVAGTLPTTSLHSTRERIVTILRDGPRSPSALAADLSISRQAVHEHLGNLARDGLIVFETRPEGRVARLLQP